jgi:hypothetical protein
MDMLLFITRNTHKPPIWSVFAEQMERKVEIAKYVIYDNAHLSCQVMTLNSCLYGLVANYNGTYHS